MFFTEPLVSTEILVVSIEVVLNLIDLNFSDFLMTTSWIDAFLPVIVVIVSKYHVVLLLIYFYRWFWIAKWWVFGCFLRRWFWSWFGWWFLRWNIWFYFLVFLHFDVKRILLRVRISLLGDSLIWAYFFRYIVIVTVFSSILAASWSWPRRFYTTIAMCWISFRSVGLYRWLIIIAWILQYLNRLIIVEIILLLIRHLCRFLRWFRDGLKMIFLLDISLRSIISFSLWPSKRNRTRPSRSLNYFFISLSIKIGIICNIFIQHLYLWFKVLKKIISNLSHPW